MVFKFIKLTAIENDRYFDPVRGSAFFDEFGTAEILPLQNFLYFTRTNINLTLVSDPF